MSLMNRRSSPNSFLSLYQIAFALTLNVSWGYIITAPVPFTRAHVALYAGQGFGKSPSQGQPKTYDAEALLPRKDIFDMESAMHDFFQASEEWKPLFRSLLSDDDLSEDSAVRTWLEDVDISQFEFHETSAPWQRLKAIPTEDADRTVLASFLDQVEASLIQIPVDETTEDDENDLQFLEEGRRMLVCGRFHVLHSGNPQKDNYSKPSNVDRMKHWETLFGVCWNEIFHLQDVNEANTGSLILVPNTELDDLRRFVDIQLQRPLQWFGLHNIFEVTSLQRGSPAIRLIHKLSDIPTDLPDEAETMGDTTDDE